MINKAWLWILGLIYLILTWPLVLVQIGILLVIAIFEWLIIKLEDLEWLIGWLIGLFLKIFKPWRR